MLSTFFEWLNGLKPQYIMAISALIGTAFSVFVGGVVRYLLDVRIERFRTKEGHEKRLEILQKEYDNSQDILIRTIEAGREGKALENEELDRSDRTVVVDSCGALIPLLRSIATINYLGDDNNDDRERAFYGRLKNQLDNLDVDISDPTSNLRLRFVFLLAQVFVGGRIAYAAKRTRSLSNDHESFLEQISRRLHNSLCSNVYPGNPFMYREHIDILADICASNSKFGDYVRPINWEEAIELYRNNEVFQEIVVQTGRILQDLLDESKPLGARKEFQVRLAIVAIYLIDTIRIDQRNAYWQDYGELWKLVKAQAAHMKKRKYYSGWYIYEKDDVLE